MGHVPEKNENMTPKSGDSGGARKVNWQWMQLMSFLKGLNAVETPTTSNFIAINGEEGSQLLLSDGAEVADLQYRVPAKSP